ncbi:hypothetical protein CRUP_011814 [Coryphaenoides rupestris]|nr:hypothetical protein CRUP_011814 [Coryphaenoides rupestris]
MSSVSKSPKSRPKKSAPRPSVSELIVRAVSGSRGRGGVSLVVLKRDLRAGGYDVAKNRSRILTSLRRLVATGSLVRTKGSFSTPAAAPRKAKGPEVTGQRAPASGSSVGMRRSPAGKRRRSVKKEGEKSPAAGSKKPMRPSKGAPPRRLTRSMGAAK